MFEDGRILRHSSYHLYEPIHRGVKASHQSPTTPG
jgi:hypothetical protein